MYVRAVPIFFVLGMSTPAMRANRLLLGTICYGVCPLRVYPWRCLCFGFSQITRTTPFLRMTLHLTQNFRTDGLTFIFVPSSLRSVGDPAPCQVVRRQLNGYPIPRQYLYEMHPHLAGDVSEHPHLVVELHPEHGIRQRLDHRTLDFYRLFFCHIPLCIRVILTV